MSLLCCGLTQAPAIHTDDSNLLALTLGHKAFGGMAITSLDNSPKVLQYLKFLHNNLLSQFLLNKYYAKNELKSSEEATNFSQKRNKASIE